MDGQDVFQLPRERVVLIRMLIEVIAGENGLLDAKSLGEVITNKGEREVVSAELAEFPVHGTGRIDAATIHPGRDATGHADTRHVLLRKPDVVGEIAAIDRQEFLDDVAPSLVNGTPCLPNVIASRLLLFHCTYASVRRT